MLYIDRFLTGVDRWIEVRKLCIQALATRDESLREDRRAGGREVRTGVKEEVKVEEEEERDREERRSGKAGRCTRS